MRDGVRARPDDAHASLQDVDELGQFVEELLEAAERGDAACRSSAPA